MLNLLILPLFIFNMSLISKMWIFIHIFSNVPTGYPRFQIFFNNEVKSSLKKNRSSSLSYRKHQNLRKLKSGFTFASCAATPLPLCD